MGVAVGSGAGVAAVGAGGVTAGTGDAIVDRGVAAAWVIAEGARAGVATGVGERIAAAEDFSDSPKTVAPQAATTTAMVSAIAAMADDRGPGGGWMSRMFAVAPRAD